MRNCRLCGTRTTHGVNILCKGCSDKVAEACGTVPIGDLDVVTTLTVEHENTKSELDTALTALERAVRQLELIKCVMQTPGVDPIAQLNAITMVYNTEKYDAVLTTGTRVDHIDHDRNTVAIIRMAIEARKHIGGRPIRGFLYDEPHEPSTTK